MTCHKTEYRIPIESVSKNLFNDEAIIVCNELFSTTSDLLNWASFDFKATRGSILSVSTHRFLASNNFDKCLSTDRLIGS